MKFYDGGSVSHWKNTNGWILPTHVRCVRSSVTIIYPIIRIDDIVTDSGTGLQWQDNWVAALNIKTWTGAIDYCENHLTLGGYTDWRLPNRNELLSIVDYSKMYPSINSAFFYNTALNDYWSSTTHDSTPSKAWVVDFRNAYSPALDKQYGHYTRCVRGGQINIPVNPSIIMYLLD